tara:strand:- start:116 stop:409 length:294 start_codon:yes stop_codon:yes gene_type:complete
MPKYTFRNIHTDEQYDMMMSYEELQEYIKQEHIEQVFKINLYRYSDNNGIKDQETAWLKDPEVKGNGKFEPYGKVKTAQDNHNYKVMKNKKHFSEKI